MTERSEVTAWPGQPLSTTDLQCLYPTTDYPAPFRPHKPWPGLGYGYSGPNVQSPPRYFPSPTPRHSTGASMKTAEEARQALSQAQDELIERGKRSAEALIDQAIGRCESWVTVLKTDGLQEWLEAHGYTVQDAGYNLDVSW